MFMALGCPLLQHITLEWQGMIVMMASHDVDDPRLSHICDDGWHNQQGLF
jgi:hypothetical protein